LLVWQALIGFSTEITELKRLLLEAQAAEAVLSEKQRLQLLVDNINVGALQIDRTGDPADPPVYPNPAMERLIGYTREEVPTLSVWFKLLHKDHDGSQVAAYNDFMKKVGGRCWSHARSYVPSSLACRSMVAMR
jgi:PAS domain-containing protein